MEGDPERLMEARAVAKYLKVGPQKARLVVDLIRGKRVDEALTILGLTRKAVSRDIAKVVKSAASNAGNTKNMDVDKLYIKRAYVDPGPTTKRMQAKAMGRGGVIRKRSSHLTVVVGER
jgi:large subunit ribosomal protein L22